MRLIKTEPKSISVCIATYNGEKYIRKQVSSILNQISNIDEIIISDDGSSDNTIDILQSINDPRIKIYFNNENHGYTANFENALNHAHNDIIILSDQDDIWDAHKVSSCLQLLQIYDFIVHDAIVINEYEEVIFDSFYEKRKVYKSLIGNFIKFGYLGCCFAFRKSVLNKALPFPKNHKLCTHDNWLFLIAKTFYNTNITDKKLLLYRRHSNNTSSGGLKNTSSFIFKIKYRLYLIKNLIFRVLK